MQSSAVLFVFAYVVWIVLAWPPDWQHAVVGVVVASLVAVLTGSLFIEQPDTMRHVSRYWRFCFVYLPLFLWECLKANFDVAYRVIHPSVPIRPALVKVRTSLKSDTALTFLANSITLTPGTMTVDIDKEAGALYIHWIDATTTDTERATDAIVKRFEGILKTIFD